MSGWEKEWWAEETVKYPRGALARAEAWAQLANSVVSVLQLEALADAARMCFGAPERAAVRNYVQMHLRIHARRLSLGSETEELDILATLTRAMGPGWAGLAAHA